MKKIKVLHIIESLDLGGAESVVADIIRNMHDSVVSEVCCLKHSGLMAQKLEGYTKNIYELNKRKGNDPFILIKLFKLIKENNIDILHAHNWNTFCESILASVLTKTPVIHTIHGHHTVFPPTAKGKLKKKIRVFCERLLSLKSNRICTVSKEIYDYIQNEIGIDSGRLAVHVNGIDTDYVYTSPWPLLCEMGVKKEDFLICFAGRLMPVKNIDSLLVAMEAVVKGCSTAKLLIVGDGPEREKLEQVIIEKGIGESVVFLGYRDDVRDILAKTDIFVLPSFYEGTSIALLEAMTAGVPAIVTDVGGNSDIVVHNETGFLYPSDDSNILSNYIKKLYFNDQLKKEMGQKARQRVNNYFCISKVAQGYVKVYTGLKSK